MITLVAFVNIFFVPVLTIYLLCRKDNNTYSLNSKRIFQYCIAVSCNIPITKVFIVIGGAMGKSISIDSGYYTIAAIISASLLYQLCMCYERILSELK